MSIRHNCGKEKDLDLSWVDPTGNTADRIKCNICGREFIDIIFIQRLKDELCRENEPAPKDCTCWACSKIDKFAGNH